MASHVPVALHHVRSSLYDHTVNQWTDARWGVTAVEDEVIFTVVDSSEHPIYMKLPADLVHGVSNVVQLLREEVQELEGGMAVLESDFEARLQLIEMKLSMISSVLNVEICDLEEFDKTERQ
jgi:hypothetical protein